MTTLTFNDRVNTAVSIVTEQYPDAKLYESDAKATGGPTTDPDKINEMTVKFQNVNNSTVIIKEISPGKFGKPELVDAPLLEDVVIQWPMDLSRANQLKEAAGFKEPYTTVNLRNPLGPQKGNPLLIFGNGSSQFVFVDTVTGKVTTGN
ncbi:7457_t:CDS:1 [Dentiscutata erythropus]|uniref:7457_t:CDS:1 n=1 Tax=Dentiscutata erythropus TaxID=1348616 RepID=A0A9N8WD14_9GLOM|nr:7457_t:CDS:1 [Dentiscutata erythropus]